MAKNDDNFLEELGIIFIFILIIGSIFEVGLLIFAYINADRVECNLLWCSFITEDTLVSIEEYQNSSQIITSMNSTSKCYINNEEVNCSEIEEYNKKWRDFTP